jgi:hypothetical protein
VWGASGGPDYLPLDQGRRWLLKSPSSSKPIVLEVMSGNAGAVQLRFENPWITSELRLIPRDGKIYVAALTMNGQTAQLPPETLYWDTTAPEKARWSSPIGKYQIVSRNKRVKAMGRDFEDCVQIEETNKQGNKLYWTFAPNVGFVQFGEGKDAFVLTSVGVSTVRAPEVPSIPPSPPTATSTRTGGIRVALAANTFANEGFDAKSVEAHFRQAREAGVNLIYISPKWNEIESGRGKYKLSDIEYQIGEAVSENLPAILHIRVVDTNQRAMPPDLVNKPFDGEETGSRLDQLLDAVLPRLNGKVKYFLLGNEIEGYFKGHPGEVEAYSKLVSRASAHIRNRVPGASVSVSTTFAGMDDAALLRPILNQTAFFAITYYPLSPDFIVRDPSTVDADFSRILAAAGSKQIFLQEVGYPTAAANGSSEDKQAELFSRVLDKVAATPDRFIGVNFTFMSDFSDSLVKTFSAYYKMPGADRFSAFLKTLGMFDDHGRPKKSWAVFQRKVRSLT